jgi:diguanylate cyclase (GGDEF)-like protein
MANLLLEKSRMLDKAGRVRAALQALEEQRDVAAKIAAGEHETMEKVLQDQFDAQRRALQIEGLRRENALKDEEIRKRRVWQLIASTGAAVALLACGFVWRLYRRSVRVSGRLRELNEELAFHSTHDALTGLLNRRSFRAEMERRTPGAGGCFVLLDIDHFKAINDRLGHAAGDEVLVEVAHRLRVCVGLRGLLLRWGGEEFLVHVDGGAPADHADLVRALLAAVARDPVTTAEGRQIEVTITAGALSLPAGSDAAIDWQHALALADQALYRGKQDGRRCAWLDAADEAGAVTRSERIGP